MRSNFYNPKKADEEKKEKELQTKELDKKALYFKRLKEDGEFKKYILEEIIQAEIKLNTDLTGSLANLIASTPNQVKDIILAKSAGKTTAENILNKITINFRG
jgi:hypothetical protein